LSTLSPGKIVKITVITIKPKNSDLFNFTSMNFCRNRTDAEVSAPFEDGIPGNPVAALQDFCTSRMLRFPIYKLSAEDGLPHERSFTFDCIIGKNTASGK